MPPISGAFVPSVGRRLGEEKGAGVVRELGEANKSDNPWRDDGPAFWLLGKGSEMGAVEFGAGPVTVPPQPTRINNNNTATAVAKIGYGHLMIIASTGRCH